MPYKERYKYSNIQPSDVKENENAAYIITTAEKKYFDETKYDFKPFRGYQTDYYAVTKNNNCKGANKWIKSQFLFHVIMRAKQLKKL